LYITPYENLFDIVQVARRAIQDDPAKAHQDILRLVSRMAIPENIPPGRTATAIVKKPREADIVQPYKKGSYQGPPVIGSASKRPRIEAVSDTGENLTNIIQTKVTEYTIDTKYVDDRPELELILRHLPSYANKQYITAAYANTTWNRMKSAIKCIEKFAIHSNTPISWPMSNFFLHTFTTWALDTQSLSHSTVKAYIHDISIIHKLKNVDHNNCKNFLLKATIKGAANLNLYEEIDYEGKAPITLDLIKKMGYQISKSDNSLEDKQVFWTALTVAFWGSFRMCEILAKNAHTLSTESLTWKDIEFNENSCSIHIKFPKVSKRGGDIIEIFKVKGLKCCPVKALQMLKSLHSSTNLQNSPFTLSSGKNLTAQVFTTHLKHWAAPYRDHEFIDRLTGHCCRAAIPRILASRPDITEKDDILVWGRWTSEAYKIYAKKSQMTRRIIFEKICFVIADSSSRTPA